jgi:hypothetical protein
MASTDALVGEKVLISGFVLFPGIRGGWVQPLRKTVPKTAAKKSPKRSFLISRLFARRVYKASCLLWLLPQLLPEGVNRFKSQSVHI